MKNTIETSDRPVTITIPEPEYPLHTLSVLVNNKPGVLARIAQVFSRRGYNIESLVVSPAAEMDFSRMTIGARGEESGLDQIKAQCNKLIDVISCYDHTDDAVVSKELALVKISVGASSRGEALQIAEHFGCKTLDLAPESLVFMVTGDSGKLDAMVGMMQKFGIVELVRTGKVVMTRGNGLT
ncbi:acetolactate synthase small subunit [Kiritimatiellota bacterium B12222]|nr:acetolactate synthase small subunit [Kiritimatiellota bacterium B12222]